MENRSSQVVRAGEIIGKSVLSYTNEKLGSIEEVVLDKLNGQAKYVVLSFGGFLGLGDKLHALPWKSISYDAGEDAFRLGVDKEKLKIAPGFDKSAWPNFADPAFTQPLSDFYT